MAGGSVRFSKIYYLHEEDTILSRTRKQSKVDKLIALPTLTESRSQSRKISQMLMKFMEVSPFVHRDDLDRLKNVALRVDIVLAKASLLANPCIKIAPVSTF